MGKISDDDTNFDLGTPALEIRGRPAANGRVVVRSYLNGKPHRAVVVWPDRVPGLLADVEKELRRRLGL